MLNRKQNQFDWVSEGLDKLYTACQEVPVKI